MEIVLVWFLALTGNITNSGPAWATVQPQMYPSAEECQHVLRALPRAGTSIEGRCIQARVLVKKGQ